MIYKDLWFWGSTESSWSSTVSMSVCFFHLLENRWWSRMGIQPMVRESCSPATKVLKDWTGAFGVARPNQHSLYLFQVWRGTGLKKACPRGGKSNIKSFTEPCRVQCQLFQFFQFKKQGLHPVKWILLEIAIDLLLLLLCTSMLTPKHHRQVICHYFSGRCFIYFLGGIYIYIIIFIMISCASS